MGTRITADLTDPALIKLLKLESQEKGKPMREILQLALECYFFTQLETRALAKASESSFDEWNNPLDAEYDSL